MKAEVDEAGDKASGLSRNSIGTFGIVIFVLAFASPLIGLTGAMPSAMVTGNGLGAPAAYVITGAILLVFAVGFIAMSRHVTNAGALYAYVGRGLGLSWGMGAAGMAVWAYTVIQVAVYAFFGVVASGTLAFYVGIEVPWFVLSIGLIVLVQLFGVLHIEVGARALLILMALEWGVMILLSLVIMVQGGAGEGFGVSEVWSPSSFLVPGLPVALIWAWASMFGFESSAIYGEEARNPRKSVARATVISVIAITAFFAFTGWMAIVGYGPSQAVDQALVALEGGDPAVYIFALGDMYLGSWAPLAMAVFVLTSMFACTLAFHNAITRYFYRLGRDRVLMKGLGKTRSNGAPHVASFVQCSIALAFIVGAVVLQADPVLVLFFWGGGIAVVTILALYVLTSVAVIVFFRRNPVVDQGAAKTLVFPLLTIVILVVTEYLIVSNFSLLVGTDANTALALASTGVIAFLVGVGVFLIRRKNLNVVELEELETEVG